MHLLTTAMTLPWVEDLQSASMGWQHGRVKNDSPMALEFLKQMHLMFFGRLCVGVSKLGITMHPSQHQASGGHRFFDCQCFNVSSAFCPFYHWGILGQLVIQVALSVTRIPGLCLTTWSTSIFAVKLGDRCISTRTRHDTTHLHHQPQHEFRHIQDYDWNDLSYRISKTTGWYHTILLS